MNRTSLCATIVAAALTASLLQCPQPPTTIRPSRSSSSCRRRPPASATCWLRLFQQKLGESGNTTTIVVENRAGRRASSAPTPSPRRRPTATRSWSAITRVLAMLPHLQKMPYDPFKSFTPVILGVTVPNILVVHPSVPAKSVQELVAYAKANPGKLTYASQGVGASGHIAAELFKLQAGIDIVHVPYKGAAPAAQDLAAGHVSMMFDVVSLALGPIQAGRVRPLGVATKERVAVLPDVPTMIEQGTPVEVGAWFGFLAPAGTPPAAIAWLNRETTKIFSAPDARGRFVNQGAAVPLGTPESFAQFIEAESDRYGDVIQRAGIKLE